MSPALTTVLCGSTVKIQQRTSNCIVHLSNLGLNEIIVVAAPQRPSERAGS